MTVRRLRKQSNKKVRKLSNKQTTTYYKKRKSVTKTHKGGARKIALLIDNEASNLSSKQIKCGSIIHMSESLIPHEDYEHPKATKYRDITCVRVGITGQEAENQNHTIRNSDYLDHIGISERKKETLRNVFGGWPVYYESYMREEDMDEILRGVRIQKPALVCWDFDGVISRLDGIFPFIAEGKSHYTMTNFNQQVADYYKRKELTGAVKIEESDLIKLFMGGDSRAEKFAEVWAAISKTGAQQKILTDNVSVGNIQHLMRTLTQDPESVVSVRYSTLVSEAGGPMARKLDILRVLLEKAPERKTPKAVRRSSRKRKSTGRSRERSRSRSRSRSRERSRSRSR